MAGKMSLRDIANGLGLSITTVSFILNGKGREKRISKDAIKRVNDYVNKKGFKSNHLAKSLATGKTLTIGLIVERISDVFFAELAYHVEKNAGKHGYKVMYCSTENDNNTARKIINLFRERHVDAFIIVPTPGIKKEIRSLIKDNIPVVLFDRDYPDINCPYVGLDNFQSTYAAVNHLTAECGRSNIGFITIDSNQTQMTDRLSGYQKAIAESKLVPHIKTVKFGHQPESLEKEITTFISNNPCLDALFFATNYLAMAGIKATGKLKLAIPRNISLVSYDDQPFYSVINPTITAIEQPLEKMAINLVNILMSKIERKEDVYDCEKIIFPAKLNIRESSRELYLV